MKAKAKTIMILGLFVTLGMSACSHNKDHQKNEQAAAAVQLSGNANVTHEPALTADMVQDELSSLRKVMVGSDFLILLVLATVGVLALIALSRWIRLVRGRRLFGSNDLSVISLILRTALIALLVVIVFVFLSTRLPIVVIGAVSVGIAALVFYAMRDVPAWMAGMTLILRRRLREGDVIEISQTKGIVEKIGLLRMVVVKDDGARAYLPIVMIGRLEVAISSPRREHVVEHTWESPRRLDDQDLERAKYIAAACPYRAQHKSLSVFLEDETNRVKVRFHTWSAPAAVQAKTYLRQAFSHIEE